MALFDLSTTTSRLKYTSIYIWENCSFLFNIYKAKCTQATLRLNVSHRYLSNALCFFYKSEQTEQNVHTWCQRKKHFGRQKVWRLRENQYGWVWERQINPQLQHFSYLPQPYVRKASPSAALLHRAQPWLPLCYVVFNCVSVSVVKR